MRCFKFRFDRYGKEQKIVLKKFNSNFKKRYNINALHRPSKLAIAEVASMSEGQDILYHNVATETDHTVFLQNIAVLVLQAEHDLIKV